MTDDDRVQPALHALLLSDSDALATALRADPDVVKIRVGENTMLEWVTQPDFTIDRDCVRHLIDHGAEVDRALNLAACFNEAGLVVQLLDSGADPTKRADAGITPAESAAMHGSAEALDVLRERHAVHRHALWLVAAAGDSAAVSSFFDNGSLRDVAGAYRPNFADVGRAPTDPPGDTPADLIDEAFVFALANGRTGIGDYLLAHGADIDARPYRNTTALHLAIQFRKLDAVLWLLGRGASADIRDDTHGSNAAGWATACDDGSAPMEQIIQILGRSA